MYVANSANSLDFENWADCCRDNFLGAEEMSIPQLTSVSVAYSWEWVAWLRKKAEEEFIDTFKMMDGDDELIGVELDFNWTMSSWTTPEQEELRAHCLHSCVVRDKGKDSHPMDPIWEIKITVQRMNPVY